MDLGVVVEFSAAFLGTMLFDTSEAIQVCGNDARFLELSDSVQSQVWV
jgi:hypothetical protein